jgi:hypothetical protein
MSYNDNVKLSKVFLPPIDDYMQNDQNLEPQFIRLRSNNNGYIFIDTEDSNSSNQNQFIVSKTGFLTSKIKRLGVGGLQYCLPIPNINIYNNSLTFHSSVSAANHTVSLTIGFYSLSAFITMLQTQLNTVTGASGLTFTVTQRTNFANSINIAAAGGTFYLPPGLSSFETYGRYMCYLQYDLVFSTSKNSSQSYLVPTRWVDVISDVFAEYDKNPVSSTRFGENHILYRLYCTYDRISNPRFEILENPNIRWVNYNRDVSLANIDFKLRDEFGNDVYMDSLDDLMINLFILTEL